MFLPLKGWFTPVQDRACYSLWETIKSQKHSLLCWEQLTPLCDQQIRVLCAFSTTTLFFLQSSNISTRGGEGGGKARSSDGEIFLQFLLFPHVLVHSTYPKITKTSTTVQGLWNSRILPGSLLYLLIFFLPSKSSIYKIFSRNMKGRDLKMKNKAEKFTRTPNPHL